MAERLEQSLQKLRKAGAKASALGRGDTSKHWNERNQNPPSRRYWYQHPTTLRFYRSQVIDSDAPAYVKPVGAKLLAEGRTFQRGISIGCGSAHKELLLSRLGLVESWDLFDLSDTAIEQGRQAIDKHGLDQSRFRFHNVDPFGSGWHPDALYDLVQWDNSLHHMFDADLAVRTSVEVLAPGGVFVMDDYIGPTYMQISEEVYAFADGVRACLPEQYLTHPDDPTRLLTVEAPRIPKEQFLRTDPSEMADSGNILSSVRRHMPDATVTPAGGAVYFLALRGLFGNFDPDNETDESLLAELLELDATYNRIAPTTALHGFAYWVKP